MSTMNSIIKEKRNALGITQKELADKLSISDKTVSRWESGNQVPDAILLPDLAEVLNISINELYGIKTETKQSIAEPEIHTPTSKFSTAINTCYKTIMSSGLATFIFGAMILIHINTIRGLNPINGQRTYGNLFTYIGLILCVGAQIAYTIISRKKPYSSPLHIKSEIAYGGVCILGILAVLLIVFPLCITVPISYLYELAVALLAVGAMVMMFFQKQKLRKAGIKISKTMGVVTNSVAVLCFLIMLAVFIYLTCFEGTIHLDKLFEHFGTISNEELFGHHLILYSFYAIALPLLSSLSVNFVHLLIKAKKLK